MIQTMTQPRSTIHRTPPVLSPQQLGALRRRLVKERNRMITEYRRDATAAQSTHGEGVEDFEELASLDLEREFLFARTEEDRETLRLIEEALQRMDERTYGLCQWSGEPIPIERLRSIPWARYSAKVQAKIENHELRHRLPTLRG